MNFNFSKIQLKNKLNQIPKIFFDDLKHIFFQIKKEGECFLVGGAVRDLFLNKIPKEYDLATSLEPDKIKSLFPKVFDTGTKHGTVTILINKKSYEITTYRRDIDYFDGRRPQKVEFCLSLEEDLSRRDFTINAIAIDILNEKIVDLYDGLGDIQKKVIRTIENPVHRFNEDGLRSIRAIRFVGQLDFTIEEETRKAISLTNHITQKISIERFQDELKKIFLSSTAEKSIYLLLEEKIFHLFIPNIQFQEVKMEQLKKIHILPPSFPIRCCFFLFLSLENKDINQIGKYLKFLKFSNQNQKEILFYIQLLEQTKSISFTMERVVFIKKILVPLAHYFSKLNQKIDLNPYLFLRESLFQNSKELTKILSGLLETNPTLLISNLQVDGRTILEDFPYIQKRKNWFCFKFLLRLLYS